MKAIVQKAYGEPEDVLSLEDVEPPSIRDDEVLVRVRAASVHPDVWHVVTGRPYVLRAIGAALRKPRNPIVGTDLAGVVESVGSNVTDFSPGDEVFGESIKGYQWVNGGAYAELAAVKPEWIALKPQNVSFEQAAAVPTAGIIALSSLVPQGRLKSGQSVLINGAGGGVGYIAVQFAVASGATVTAVDIGTKRELLQSAGAHHFIDYTQRDFTAGEERYDLVLDIPGNHPFSKIKRVLTADGVYVIVGHDGYGNAAGRWFGSIPKVFRLMARTPFSRHLPKSGFSTPNKQESMETLRALMEAGKLAPVIDRSFPLAEAAQAIRYLADGKAIGRVVVTP